MKKSFVYELSHFVLENTYQNSYYDDENDVECYTPDYDSAYKYLQERKSITKKDLEETLEFTDDDGYQDTYTGLDLVKLAIKGDFDQEFNAYSSKLENLRATLCVFDATKGDQSVWESKETLEEDQELEYYNGLEYRLKSVRCQSLAEIALERVVSSSLHWRGCLKQAKQVASRLKNYKGFEYTSSDLGVTQALKSNTITKKDIEKAARFAKNERYSSIESLSKRELSIAATKYLVFGKSGDKTFDSTADKLPSLKSIISEKGKGADLDI